MFVAVAVCGVACYVAGIAANEMPWVSRRLVAWLLLSGVAVQVGLTVGMVAGLVRP